MQQCVIPFKGMPLFHKASIAPPFTMQGEIKDVACFFYVSKGVMTSFDKRGRHITATRNAILKNCGHYIQEFTKDNEFEECEAIAVFLYPQLLKEIYKDEVPSFLTQAKVPTPKQLIGNQLIEQYMMNLSVYFENPSSLDEELAILKLKELVLILLKSENHENVRQFLSEIFSPINVSLKQAVENNLYNRLNIDQLAYICNMSLSTFKREFKKTFQQTPAKYIKQKRLEKAASLLRSTRLQVSEIAYDTGFIDPSTFSTNFHEKYGCSPRKYRLS
ncbi:MAG: AraC family transcriptional regulator [Saprospiraceae bacterium]|nr:AraC family transcriptional regulator [Saprospiraceae bacterium]